ncbi:MAG: hypothetical protein ACK56I_27935, partial [bacterium]
MALTPVVGHHFGPGQGVAAGPGHRDGRPGGASSRCCNCRFEDPFPQRQLHYPLQLCIGEGIGSYNPHLGLRRLAARYVKVAGLPAVLFGVAH